MNVDVIRALNQSMSFSIKTVLFALLVVAAFLGGWILPPPVSNVGQTPVLISVRDIPIGTAVNDTDFRIVYRNIADVPDYAARDYSDLKGIVTKQRIRCNSFIFLDETYSTRTLTGPYVPPGKKVVAIKVTNQLDKFTWYLLESGDIVSVYANHANDSNAKICLIPRCTVFSKPNEENPSIVGLWLTEPESKLVTDAQKQEMYISLERPE